MNISSHLSLLSLSLFSFIFSIFSFISSIFSFISSIFLLYFSVLSERSSFHSFSFQVLLNKSFLFLHSESKDRAVLERASSEIRENYGAFGDFQATSVFTATYSDVSHFKSSEETVENDLLKVFIFFYKLSSEDSPLYEKIFSGIRKHICFYRNVQLKKSHFRSTIFKSSSQRTERKVLLPFCTQREEFNPSMGKERFRTFLIQEHKQDS